MRTRRSSSSAWLALVLMLLTASACSAGSSSALQAPSPTPPSTATATAAPSPSATSAPAGVPGPPGTISGDQLMYPGDSMPALAIYAVSTTDSHTYFRVTTKPGQFSYAIAGVAPGTYYVVAYLASTPSPAFKAVSGGYTAYVVCAVDPMNLDCKDHTLLPVTVGSTQGVSGVNPNDYYGATIPPKPGA